MVAHPLVQAAGRAFGPDVLEAARRMADQIEQAITGLADLTEPNESTRAALMAAARLLSKAYGAFAAGITTDTNRWVRAQHGAIAAKWKALGFAEPFLPSSVADPLTPIRRAG